MSQVGALFVHVDHLVGFLNRVDEIVRLLEEILVVVSRVDDVELLIQVELAVDLVREHHLFLGRQSKLFGKRNIEFNRLILNVHFVMVDLWRFEVKFILLFEKAAGIVHRLLVEDGRVLAIFLIVLVIILYAEALVERVLTASHLIFFLVVLQRALEIILHDRRFHGRLEVDDVGRIRGRFIRMSQEVLILESKLRNEVIELLDLSFNDFLLLISLLVRHFLGERTDVGLGCMSLLLILPLLTVLDLAEVRDDQIIDYVFPFLAHLGLLLVLLERMFVIALVELRIVVHDV